MTYTLDTNAVAAILRDNEVFVERMNYVLNQDDRITINAMTYFETRRGLYLPTFRKKLENFEQFADLFGVLPLDTAALDVSASIYQDLRRKGTPLEDADILIAGIAIANDAVLVTRNTKHFARIEGLRLEDWETS